MTWLLPPLFPTAGTLANDYRKFFGGSEGWKAGVNYTFAKNIVGTVEYVDLDAKDDVQENKSLWSQVVFTF